MAGRPAAAAWHPGPCCVSVEHTCLGTLVLGHRTQEGCPTPLRVWGGYGCCPYVPRLGFKAGQDAEWAYAASCLLVLQTERIPGPFPGPEDRRGTGEPCVPRLNWGGPPDMLMQGDSSGEGARRKRVRSADPQRAPETSPSNTSGPRSAASTSIADAPAPRHRPACPATAGRIHTPAARSWLGARGCDSPHPHPYSGPRCKGTPAAGRHPLSAP